MFFAGNGTYSYGYVIIELAADTAGGNNHAFNIPNNG
jgi:hypothetical protein